MHLTPRLVAALNTHEVRGSGFTSADVIAAWREARETPDPRDAVVTAARKWRVEGGASRFQRSISACGDLADAVDALDAAERPRYEAWGDGLSGAWAAGVRTRHDGKHPEYPNAVFGGPGAERNARDFAARLNGEQP